MKRFKKLILVFGFSGTAIFLSIGSIAHMQKTPDTGLVLGLRSVKDTYKLGEPISISIDLKNESEKKVRILDGFNFAESKFQLQVSRDGQEYRGSNDPGWGTIDTINSRVDIEPGQSVSINGNILWRMSAKNQPEFIFREPGNLFFRVLYDYKIDGTKDEMRLVSDPIEITIVEPQGEDLEVWNKIKDDGNFAYLIQRDEILIPSYKKEERSKFKQKVEEIIRTHPSNSYAESLNQSLTKLNAAEEKRKAMIEKVSQPR
ncbi:MAG TPA: hypothetical protein VK612_04040 [Pyrinomonadaceae bacterium]|nr:hypothetical protein [Pyrinomonadaceae bacterium]